MFLSMVLLMGHIVYPLLRDNDLPLLFLLFLPPSAKTDADTDARIQDFYRVGPSNGISIADQYDAPLGNLGESP